MVASVTTGKTIGRAMECIQYYNGQLAGICALFSAVEESNGIPIHSLFSLKDIPDYQNFSPHECPYCKEHTKIDAMVNSYGYTKFLKSYGNFALGWLLAIPVFFNQL